MNRKKTEVHKVIKLLFIFIRIYLIVLFMDVVHYVGIMNDDVWRLAGASIKLNYIM